MKPAIPAAKILERGAIPWFFAAALATTAPHFLHQVWWLSLLAGITFATAAWLWWNGRKLPGRWPLFLAVIVGCAAVLFEYRSLFGRDAGVAMLVVFMSQKLLELKQRRDAHVLAVLGYFLLLTHFLYSQSIATGAWLLTATLIVSAALVRLHGGPTCRPREALSTAGLLLAQSVPLMLLLYLLFPRIAGPLWNLPQDAHNARSGLSEQMSPGSIANLVQSSEIAFRARFEQAVPPREQLYWRGPVMDHYDGMTWRPATRRPEAAPQIESSGTRYRYTMTLEPHDQRWLLALDVPTSLPAQAIIGPGFTILSREPLELRQRVEFTSSPSYRFNVKENPASLNRALQLPPTGNPRARALATGWQSLFANPAARIAAALALFRQQNFHYTLQPPLLGADPVDDFLFSSRRGFCEHYASAFTFLMRAAGVPARVIGGYQGGELNPLDGHLVIRQSDAHAWSEVWLAERGWVRIDPTAAISPARVESGMAAALPEGDPLPVLLQIRSDWLRQLRYRWEAVNNGWNQWVLGYNPERQRALLARLGLSNPDWRQLAALLAIAAASSMLGLGYWAVRQHTPIDPAQRLWRQAQGRLRRRGITCPDWEAPLALQVRLQNLAEQDVELKKLAEAMKLVTEHYCAARYGSDPQGSLKALRRALATLP